MTLLLLDETSFHCVITKYKIMLTMVMCLMLDVVLEFFLKFQRQSRAMARALTSLSVVR